MKNNLRFILALIRMKLSKMMVFRLTFFGVVFVDGTLFLMQLLMYQAIYSQVDTIGGWTRGEMIIFIGTFSLINALNMSIFFFGTYDIPNKIKNGDLDHYLTKPVNPLLRLTFESVDPGSIPLAIASIVLILYGVKNLEIKATPVRFIAYFLFVLLMTLLWYDLQMIVRTIPFFTISAANIARMGDTVLELCMKLPGTLFHGVYKVLFYLVLPYGIMATIPTQFIAGQLTPLGILYGIFIVVIFTGFTLWFWRFGLRHYKSASS
ncbi:MAG TPA: ABC-2 family transporter protein [Mobilitalea sp.]|nr:ABC-2 family transporter protein [Mobilitalea sp.]